jgi:hypothetical protein
MLRAVLQVTVCYAATLSFVQLALYSTYCRPLQSGTGCKRLAWKRDSLPKTHLCAAHRMLRPLLGAGARCL